MTKLIFTILLLITSVDRPGYANSVFECILLELRDYSLKQLVESGSEEIKPLIKSIEIRTPLKEQLSNPDTRVITADINGQTLGFLTFTENNGNLKLNDLFVHSPGRGNKIGTKLITELKNKLSGSNLKSITIEVPKEDLNGLSFFLKNGFSQAENSVLSDSSKHISLIIKTDSVEAPLRVRQSINNFLKITGSQKRIVLNSPLLDVYEQIWKTRPPSLARKYFNILDEIPTDLLAKIEKPNNYFARKLLVRSSEVSQGKLREAIELLKDDALTSKISRASEAHAFLKNESLISKIITDEEKDVVTASKKVMEDLGDKYIKLLKQYRPIRGAVRKYNKILSSPISSFETAKDLEKSLLELKAEVPSIFSKQEKYIINKQLDEMLENLDEDSLKIVKEGHPEAKVQDLVQDSSIIPKKLGRLAGSADQENWLKSLVKSCKKESGLVNLKSCMSKLLGDLKKAGSKAGSPISGQFKRLFPCLAANPLLLSDVFIYIGFYAYHNYSTFKDAGADNPEIAKEDRWREIPWEYLASVLVFAFPTSEFSCRAAVSGKGPRQFGNLIDPMFVKAGKSSTFIGRAKNLMYVNMGYVATLSALQYLADRVLDRHEKRSIKDMLLEFPGKLAFFGVWGAVKNIMVTRYVKDGFVPWATRAIFPAAMKDSLIAQLAIMIPTVRLGVGKIMMMDNRYHGEKFWFPLGKTILAVLSKESHPEEFAKQSKEDQAAVNAAEAALKEALKELGLTLDDLELQKGEDGKVQFTVKDDKHLQVQKIMESKLTDNTP